LRGGREAPPRRDAGGPRRGRQWPLRLVGSLFGVGAGVVGLLSLLGAGELPDFERERATGFGIAALVVGAVALLGSLAVRDAQALWYCSPRRWAPFKADVLDELDAGASAPPPLRSTEDPSAGP